jgi:hypothetical protein
MICKKFLHWSSKQLSFPSKIVVANQVLLATIWYTGLVWIFSRFSMLQIQWIVRNFLSFGNDVTTTCRAKFTWWFITLPRSKGGLRWIAPWKQSQALILKFMIRSLLPNASPWKSLLYAQLHQCAPSNGEPWEPSIRGFLCFRKNWQYNVLKKVQRAITYNVIHSRTEYIWEYLLWNPKILSTNGYMLKERTRLTRGLFQRNIAGNMKVFWVNLYWSNAHLCKESKVADLYYKQFSSQIGLKCFH